MASVAVSEREPHTGHDARWRTAARQPIGEADRPLGVRDIVDRATTRHAPGTPECGERQHDDDRGHPDSDDEEVDVQTGIRLCITRPTKGEERRQRDRAESRHDRADRDRDKRAP